MNLSWKKRGILAAALFLVLGLSTPVEAQPKRGVGIYGGVADHTSEATAFPGTEYNSDGVSLGVDFQLPVGELFSLNVFYLTSFEDSPELVAGIDVSNSIIGAQFRVWPVAGFYLGAHAGLYNQRLSASTGGSSTSSTSGSSTGFGVAAGYEAEISEKIVVLFGFQSDAASGLPVFADTDVDLTGTRFHAGVRIILGN